MLENESLHQKKSPLPMRTIKSFVRREGRITRGQKDALERLWPQFVIDSSDIYIATNESVIWLEIGFGNGASLAEQAQYHPDIQFIGVEVYRAGVGHLLNTLEEKHLSNVKIYNHDAIEILKNCIPKQAVDRIQLFFPDPWPKKRHHKRRIVQPDFLELIATILKPNGIFHFASDWEPYAEYVQEVMAAQNLLIEIDAKPFADARPKTKFEQRGERLGHRVTDLVYQINVR